MDADIAAIRKKLHDRMFACQQAADEELEANGATGEYGILQEEAKWLSTLLADVDAAFAPNAAVTRELQLSK